jgi:hypothetical protein
MKSFKCTGWLVACLCFVQFAAAQSGPAISNRYSNNEIAGMLQTYRTSRSHDAVPPAGLATRFGADFPKAREVEWEMAGDVYEVEFDLKSRDCKAYYDIEGHLLAVVQEIRPSELPAAVKNTAKASYPKYHFEDIEKIRRGTEVLYRIEMEHRDAEAEFVLREDGMSVTDWLTD